MAEKANGKWLVVFRCTLTGLLALIASGCIFLSSSVYSGTIERTEMKMRINTTTDWRQQHQSDAAGLREKRQAAEIRAVKMASSIEKIKDDVAEIKFQLASSDVSPRTSVPTTNGGTP